MYCRYYVLLLTPYSCSLTPIFNSDIAAQQNEKSVI